MTFKFNVYEKDYILMATAFVLLSGKAQAQFAEISSDLDPQTGDIIAADINDDGLLDIVLVVVQRML